jgi:hypothetical protein
MIQTQKEPDSPFQPYYSAWDDDDPEIPVGWGSTPEEAIEDYLEDLPSPESQNDTWPAQDWERE